MKNSAPCVYICFHDTDKETAETISGHLKTSGINCWCKSDEIRPGDDIPWKTRQAIYASDYILLLLTQKITSKSGAFQREIKIAEGKMEEKPEGQICIIPVSLDGQGLDKYQISDQFKKLHHVDLSKDFQNGIDKIIETIGGHETETTNRSVNETISSDNSSQGTIAINDKISYPVYFVIATMNKDQLSQLFERNTPFREDLSRTDKDILSELQERYENQFPYLKSGRCLSCYGADCTHWNFFLHSPDHIESRIMRIIDEFNRRQENENKNEKIYASFYRDDFFNPDKQGKIWEEIESRCVIIIDALSVFHPDCRKILLDSGTVTNQNVKIIALLPISPWEIPVNKLVEKQYGDWLKRAFRRFENDRDKSCELGLGDLRGLYRWIDAILPDFVSKKPNPEQKAAQQGRFSREQIEKVKDLKERIFFGGSK